MLIFMCKYRPGNNIDIGRYIIYLAKEREIGSNEQREEKKFEYLVPIISRKVPDVGEDPFMFSETFLLSLHFHPYPFLHSLEIY